MDRSPKKWNPQTKKYDYNYGVGFNFYQPMVDYIEEKAGGRKIGFPHLPWTEELGLDQFDPLAIKSYSEEDLARVSRKTEASAKERLRDFKSSASSSFVLSKSVSAATLTHKVKREEKKKKALVTEINKLKTRMYDDLENYNPNKDKQIEAELMAQQKYLRGKSAKQIESQLLSQSRKAIAESVDQDIKQAQKTKLGIGINVKAHQTTRTHVTMMDKRIQEQLEESFTRPLDNLSCQLKDFDKRSATYFMGQSKM